MKKIGLAGRSSVATAIMALPIFLAVNLLFLTFRPGTSVPANDDYLAIIFSALICSALLALMQYIWLKQSDAKPAQSSSRARINTVYSNNPELTGTGNNYRREGLTFSLIPQIEPDNGNGSSNNLGYLRHDLGERDFKQH